MNRLILIALLLLFSVGCISATVPQPAYDAPLSGRKIGSSSVSGTDIASHKDLRVAIVQSKNTKNALRYVEQLCESYAQYNPSEPNPDMTIDVLVRGVRDALSGLFSTVIEAESVELAQSQQADLIVIQDGLFDLQGNSGATTSVELRLIFLRPDLSQLVVVSGKGQFVVPWPATTSGTRQASEMAFKEFQANLLNTPCLADIDTALHHQSALQVPPHSPSAGGEGSPREIPPQTGQSPAAVIDFLNKALLSNSASSANSIVPGNTPSASSLQQARSVAQRKAEIQTLEAQIRHVDFQMAEQERSIFRAAESGYKHPSATNSALQSTLRTGLNELARLRMALESRKAQLGSGM